MTLALTAQEIEKNGTSFSQTLQLGWEVLLGMGVCGELSCGHDVDLCQGRIFGRQQRLSNES